MAHATAQAGADEVRQICYNIYLAYMLQSATRAHTSPAINGLYIRQTNARVTHNTAW